MEEEVPGNLRGWYDRGVKKLTFMMLLALFCGPGDAAQTAKPFRILFSANRQGEIDPCGCQVKQIGGIDRLLNFSNKEAKKAGPQFFVDSGDTFFALKQINEFRVDEERLKADVIAEAYRHLKVDAIVPGERDFADGLDAFYALTKKAEVKVIAANIVNEKNETVFAPFTIVEKKGVRLAFIGLYSPEAKLPQPTWKVLDPAESASKIQTQLEGEKLDGLFVLSNLGLADDRKLAEKISVPVIFGARSMDFLEKPVVVNQTLIVQPQIQGQNIGELEFSSPGTANSKHRLVDLGVEWQKPNNAVTKLIANYKKKVRDLAVAASHSAEKKIAAKGANPFVAHPNTCRTCHTKQHDFWEQTKHASAYLVLYAKNQHFDPECIGCHTLGFQSPNGFEKRALPILIENENRKKGELPFVEKLMQATFKGDSGGALDSREDPARYAKLKKKYHAQIHELEDQGKIQKIFIGVQCEHCHGNRNGHPDPSVPTVKKVSDVSCKECHTPPHAKPYNPATFKLVACPSRGTH